MRITITIPDKQMKKIDQVADYLGVKRSKAVHYLITQGMSAEQFKLAAIDTAEGTRVLAKIAEADLAEYQKSLQVPVTLEEGEINCRQEDKINYESKATPWSEEHG